MQQEKTLPHKVSQSYSLQNFIFIYFSLGQKYLDHIVWGNVSVVKECGLHKENNEVCKSKDLKSITVGFYLKSRASGL